MTGRNIDAITLRIGGAEYNTWTRVQIDHDLLSPADAFQFALARSEVSASAWHRVLAAVIPGVRVEVLVNGVVQMIGIIDEVLVDDSQGTQLHVSGRDLAGQLEWDPVRHLVYEQVTLHDFVRTIVEPVGIVAVRSSNVANRELLRGTRRSRNDDELPEHFRALTAKAVKSDQGDTAWEVLDRQVRRFGLMPWMAADGSIVLSKPDYEQRVDYSLFRRFDGRGNNILPGVQYRRSIAELPSQVTVEFHGGGGDSERSRGRHTETADFRHPDGASAFPPGIRHARTVRDHEVKNRDHAISRARREISHAGQGWRTYQCSVRGFTQGDYIWTPDSTVRVDDDVTGVLNEIWYLHGRTFLLSREGAVTQLRLSPLYAIVP